MTHLGTALLLDLRLQARSKLYHIGSAVAAATGLCCRYLVPTEYLGPVLAVLYLVAVGGTTYTFGAAMLLLDRSQRTLDALRTSPFTAQEYMVSKALSLTGFALVEAAIVVALAARDFPVSPLSLAAGVLALGLLYTFVGLGQVSSYDSVTTFLFPGALVVSLILQLPFLHVVGVPPGAAWYFVPTQGPLLLMLGAFEPLETWQWIYAVGVSVSAVLGAYAFARVRFRRHVRLRES